MKPRTQILVIGALALMSAAAMIPKDAGAYQAPRFRFPIDIIIDRTWLPRKAPADDLGVRARTVAVTQVARRTVVRTTR